MGINNKQHRRQKKRKNIKKKSTKKNTKTIGPVFKVMPNPFEGLNESDHKKAIKEIDENSKVLYEESLVKIKSILTRNDPLMLLSALSSYGSTVHVGIDGVKAKDNDRRLEQAHIELCQAFALQIPAEELERFPSTPNNLQELWDALLELTTSYTYRGISDKYDGDLQNNKSIEKLQEWIRGNTHIVRNWGYYSQVISISKEMYKYFDELLQNNYGFGSSDIINLFELLVKEIESANTDRYKKLRELMQVKGNSNLIYKYYDLTGQSKVSADQFILKFKAETIPKQQLFFMLLSHYDLFLPDLYTFSPSYLSEKLNINCDAVKNILDYFSYSWGGLNEYKEEYIHLSNPVWLRPIIKIGNDRYFCACPQMFFSFVMPSIESLIEKLDKQAISQRRANYLELKIVDIITSRFPEANTLHGLKWKVDEVEYETDLITFIDSCVIIVEAKSGKISESALRGAPDRLRRHIEDILVSPNIQSKRLKCRLEELVADPKIEDSLRDDLPIDLSDVHKIIRVSVSLDDFGAIQSNINVYKETGWLPDDFEPCPTMNLADFETLFDFLEHPVQIIHYLERRQELESEFKYFGDELDLMGLYISTLFNMGDIDSDADFMMMEMSSPLDEYYNSRDAGINLTKPIPKISPLFSDILSQLEKRKSFRWTEIGVILHRFSPDDQISLTRMIKTLNKNVKKEWMIEGHKNIAIFIPPKASQFSLSYIVYNEHNADRRDEYVQEAARYGLEAKHVEQCLVIAKNMDKDDLSYHFIGLMEKAIP